MKKPVVMNSYEDDGGLRCVDIRKHEDGAWSWAECRRDPEDATGWRILNLGEGYGDEAAAFAGAMGAVDWLRPPREG
ncbi:hypothetical protein AIOL_003309 [Candidatus Rhodobacter oscarellae]|uniref:Uncharacterized protein n=1 Tax=Candidatus Rhodobacter oscarellae TaxID=1675527 RepID=A0A0J9E6P6_9RHOB|nr:hypothetical protein [Candidatus Rhodobacter lobularis]KMW58336.1 hypothetical protein AIOL_003309 [Candidatus Rhodobacter lobularis]